MPFEVFDRRVVPRSNVPALTIQKGGLFSLNRAAYIAMGSPEAVELLFDKANNLVGLRPVDSDIAHSYTIRPQNPGKETGPVTFSGSAFTKHYGIDTTVSRRWTPTWSEGILQVDLNQEGSVVVGNRSSSKGNRSDRNG